MRSADATYRTPEASAPQNGSRSSSPGCGSRFHQTSAAAAAMKLAALMPNTTGVPKADSTMPASAGPIARAAFTVTPPSPDAAAICSRGTSSGWIACHAGAVSADAAPMSAVNTSSTHGVSPCMAAMTVRPIVITALAQDPQMSSLRRSRESESTPAGSDKSTDGARLAVCTSAMIVAPAALSTRNHCAPTVCIQVPMLLPSCANQSTRKTGIASGAHAETRVVAVIYALDDSRREIPIIVTASQPISAARKIRSIRPKAPNGCRSRMNDAGPTIESTRCAVRRPPVAVDFENDIPIVATVIAMNAMSASRSCRLPDASTGYPGGLSGKNASRADVSAQMMSSTAVHRRAIPLRSKRDGRHEREDSAQDEVDVHEPGEASAAVIAFGVAEHAVVGSKERQDDVDRHIDQDADEGDGGPRAGRSGGDGFDGHSHIIRHTPAGRVARPQGTLGPRPPVPNDSKNHEAARCRGARPHPTTMRPVLGLIDAHPCALPLPLAIQPHPQKERVIVLDFKSDLLFKLKEIKPEEGLELVQPMLLDDEKIFASFKTVRDHVIFTNHRIITVNVEGITGKKKDYTSLPFIKVQAFSVRTASLFATDTIMDIWFNSMGIVTFEFSGRFDIAAFNKLIGQYILKAPGSN